MNWTIESRQTSIKVARILLRYAVFLWRTQTSKQGRATRKAPRPPAAAQIDDRDWQNSIYLFAVTAEALAAVSPPLFTPKQRFRIRTVLAKRVANGAGQK